MYTHHSIDNNALNSINYPNDYEFYKYDSRYPAAIATNYYPMYPHFTSSGLKRDASASSFMSDTKLNFNKTGTSESYYIPEAASLYGSVGGVGVCPAYLNISHVRNNTGSADIGHENTMPLTAKHRPVNLSHDFSLNRTGTSKMWVNPVKGRAYDDLIEINSSGFLSEEKSIFEARSRSTSPNHCRSISNLNEPGFMNENYHYLNMPKNINRISEERKSDEDVLNQEMEDMIAPILTEVQPVKLTPPKSKPQSSKGIPTSSIVLPTDKKQLQTGSVAFIPISASRLKAKSDDIGK